jgi:hypothetical protein
MMLMTISLSGPPLYLAINFHLGPSHFLLRPQLLVRGIALP